MTMDKFITIDTDNAVIRFNRTGLIDSGTPPHVALQLQQELVTLAQGLSYVSDAKFVVETR